MDWRSRYVLAWRLSNTLEAGFCAEALEEALAQGQPEVFNTDQSLPLRRQGAVSSPAWSSPRSSRAQREDQHGRQGEVAGQHLRGGGRTVKYEEMYLKACTSILEAQRGLEDYLRFYNGIRPHQALGYRTPAEVFHGDQDVMEGYSSGRRCSPGQETESPAGEPEFPLNSALILSK